MATPLIAELSVPSIGNDLETILGSYSHLTPEAHAALIWPVGYDDLGYPIEFRKEPMVSHRHNLEVHRVFMLLTRHFRELGHPTTVASELPVLWRELSRDTFPVGPDVMVIRGVDILSEPAGAKRRELQDQSFRVWEYQGKVPDFALEICSERTWKHDISRAPEGKLAKYESLGVGEYLVADVREKWIDPPLRMWRRTRGRLREIKPESTGKFLVRSLELYVDLEGGHVHFYLPNGARLQELDSRVDEAEMRADCAVQSADLAKQRAEHEKQRAEQAELQAGEEKQRADRAEEEVQLLARQLEELKARLEEARKDGDSGT